MSTASLKHNGLTIITIDSLSIQCEISSPISKLWIKATTPPWLLAMTKSVSNNNLISTQLTEEFESLSQFCTVINWLLKHSNTKYFILDPTEPILSPEFVMKSNNNDKNNAALCNTESHCLMLLNEFRKLLRIWLHAQFVQNNVHFQSILSKILNTLPTPLNWHYINIYNYFNKPNNTDLSKLLKCMLPYYYMDEFLRSCNDNHQELELYC